MKRPTYFISGRSSSADILGAELVLAIREQHSRVEGYCIAGEALKRTRIPVISDLSDCTKTGLHDGIASTEGQGLKGEIISQLDELTPQVAIFVGYSALHHELAKYFSSRSIPVVLYGLTPPKVWQKIELKTAAQYISLAIGMFPKADPFVTKASIPYRFLGSPMRDRVDRVSVSPEAIGLPKDREFLSLLPGNSLEEFNIHMPCMLSVGRKVADQGKNVVVICSLAGHIYEFAKAKKFPFLAKLKVEAKEGTEYLTCDNIIFFNRMALELMSVAKVAVTGCGASSAEAALLATPVIAIAGDHDKGEGYMSLANQIAEDEVHPEYMYSDPIDPVVEKIQQLMKDGDPRDEAIRKIKPLRTLLTGFAAENTAELVGTEIASWNTKRKAKGALPA